MMGVYQFVRRFPVTPCFRALARSPDSKHFLVIPARSSPHIARSFSASATLDAREWLKHTQNVHLKKYMEKEINVVQLEEEKKYSKFSRLNIALAVVGVVAGTFAGDVLEKRIKLDARDREGHDNSLRALSFAVGVVAVAFLVEFISAVDTAGIHPPFIVIGSFIIACVVFRIGSRTYKSIAGTGRDDKPEGHDGNLNVEKSSTDGSSPSYKS